MPRNQPDDAERMETAGPLFDPKPLARRSDPAASRIAAAMAEPLIRGHQLRILSYLRDGIEDPATGGTKDEIAAGTGLESVAVARRMRALASRGLVEEHGMGLSSSGRPATRWRATS